jgi:hypothetical protein
MFTDELALVADGHRSGARILEVLVEHVHLRVIRLAGL